MTTSSKTHEVDAMTQAGKRPAEIAKALGITVPGVRYHLRKLNGGNGNGARRSGGSELIDRLQSDADEQLARLDAELDQATAALQAAQDRVAAVQADRNTIAEVRAVLSGT